MMKIVREMLSVVKPLLLASQYITSSGQPQEAIWSFLIQLSILHVASKPTLVRDGQGQRTALVVARAGQTTDGWRAGNRHDAQS